MLWLSVIPPLIAIIVTFITKKLILSLFIGVFAGSLISKGSFFNGITSIGTYIADAIASRESAYTLAFLVAFGSLADLIKMAGGIAGFSNTVERWIKSEKDVFIWSWLLSIITFFDSSFHTIAVGTMLSPLLRKVEGAKEKFAFILSVTSRQLILLIPIATSYIGYMTTVVANNIKDTSITESAYRILAKSVLWNFFAWSMLLIALGVSLAGLGFGKLRIGGKEGKSALTKAHLERLFCSNQEVEEYPKKASNLIIPVTILIFSTIFFFWWTGRRKTPSFLGALSSAEYSISIFSGVLLTLLITSIYFLFQKISLAEIEAHIISGGEKVLALVMVLALSWALTKVTQDLGFNQLIGPSLIKNIPRFLIPAVIFLLTAVIAYTIGSSWATWALMMPLAVAFSVNGGIYIAVMVGTVWAGGAVSDVVSPLSSDMADISFGDHLTTSFPYLLAGVVITIITYGIAGFFI